MDQRTDCNALGFRLVLDCQEHLSDRNAALTGNMHRMPAESCHNLLETSDNCDEHTQLRVFAGLRKFPISYSCNFLLYRKLREAATLGCSCVLPRFVPKLNQLSRCAAVLEDCKCPTPPGACHCFGALLTHSRTPLTLLLPYWPVARDNSHTHCSNFQKWWQIYLELLPPPFCCAPSFEVVLGTENCVSHTGNCGNLRDNILKLQVFQTEWAPCTTNQSTEESTGTFARILFFL